MMEFSIKQREFGVLGEGIDMVPNPDWEVKVSEGDSTFPGTGGYQQLSFRPSAKGFFL